MIQPEPLCRLNAATIPTLYTSFMLLGVTNPELFAPYLNTDDIAISELYQLKDCWYAPREELTEISELLWKGWQNPEIRAQHKKELILAGNVLIENSKSDLPVMMEGFAGAAVALMVIWLLELKLYQTLQLDLPTPDYITTDYTVYQDNAKRDHIIEHAIGKFDQDIITFIYRFRWELHDRLKTSLNWAEPSQHKNAAVLNITPAELELLIYPETQEDTVTLPPMPVPTDSVMFVKNNTVKILRSLTRQHYIDALNLVDNTNPLA